LEQGLLGGGRERNRGFKKKKKKGVGQKVLGEKRERGPTSTKGRKRVLKKFWESI